ncbi:hypothetical protein ACHAO7_005233 [Fusarium culmorum]
MQQHWNAKVLQGPRMNYNTLPYSVVYDGRLGIFLQQNMMDKRSVQQRSLAPSGQSLIDAEVKKRLAKTEEEEDKK